jgi:predicted naringenin-chalcone synthase
VRAISSTTRCPWPKEAVGSALPAAIFIREEVGVLATVSCTGYANPGLDVHLAKDLGIRPNCSPISKSFSSRDR